MTRWRHCRDALGGRYVLAPAREPGTGARLDGDEAARVLRCWVAEAAEHELRVFYEELTGRAAADWSTRADLAESLSQEAWRVAVLHDAAGDVRMLVPAEEHEPPPEPEVQEVEHDLNFTFVYPDGTEAGGWEYRLTDPNGSETDGTLGDDGLIEESDVPPGTYQVELKEVSSVGWLEPTATIYEPAPLIANVWGVADGTAAKVRLFREYQEQDEQVLQEMDATVEGNTVRCELEYDYTADDVRKAEQGVARLVAEVSLEGGKLWNKTSIPLELQLKTLESVRWESPRVGPERDAVVVARILGYPPGAEAKMELWMNDPQEGPTKLADLTVPIEHDQARKALRFAPSDDPDAPPFESDTIQQTGEYFVVVVIEDDVRREGRSPVVFCDARIAARAA